jgi:hypothetical protein
MSDKKKEQLGMNPSTASGRLVKDVLWSLIVQTKQDVCCKCKQSMTRETFSIEHVKPWLDSNDPVGLYFDLDNISFSHLSCNISDARKDTNSRIEHHAKRKGVPSGTGRRILAENLETGQKFVLIGELDIINAGFQPSHVYSVCRLARQSHSGHNFIYLD